MSSYREEAVGHSLSVPSCLTVSGKWSKEGSSNGFRNGENFPLLNQLKQELMYIKTLRSAGGMIYQETDQAHSNYRSGWWSAEPSKRYYVHLLGSTVSDLSAACCVLQLSIYNKPSTLILLCLQQFSSNFTLPSFHMSYLAKSNCEL